MGRYGTTRADEQSAIVDSLEHEEHKARADDQDHVNVEYCCVRCHHEPAITTESISAGERFPFLSDFGHTTRWVIRN